MIVGFTGTQRGMNSEQWLTLWRMLCDRAPGDFHEGDCIGADAQAAFAAREAGFRIVSHPPTLDVKRAFFPADEVRPALPYMERNCNIVDAAQEVIATPGEFQMQVRSGTWSTVRYARRSGKPVYVVLPDGKLLLL